MLAKLIVIVLGLGMIVPASASSANPNLYIKGVKQTKEPATPTEFKGTNNSALLLGKDIELPIVWCPETGADIEVSGRFLTPKEGAVSIAKWDTVHGDCKVVNNAASEEACTASLTVLAESNGVLTKAEVVTVKKQATPKTLGSVLIASEAGFQCAYRGEGEVAGEQVCRLPKMTVEEYDHTIECLGEESKNLQFAFTFATQKTVSAPAELWLLSQFTELTMRPVTKWSIR